MTVSTTAPSDGQLTAARLVYLLGVADLLPHELVTMNLRRLTEEQGIPLSVLADRAGIDRRQLFDMMAGEYDADLDWIERLAEVLEVPLRELFRNVPPPTRH